MLRKSSSRRSSHLRLANAPAEEEEEEEEEEEPAEGVDEPIDTVAAVFRILARTARDDEAARTLEAWARHLLVLSPSPRTQAQGKLRDWRGARSFAVAHVQARSENVEQRLAGMRDVMWEMIESVSRTVGEETSADDRVAGCIERLRTSLEAPAEEFRRQAFGALDDLVSLMEEREERQRRLAGSLGSRVAELSLELAEARREADRDSLTELANRSVFDRELERAAHLCTLTREPSSLLLIDIDDFKSVNDTLGHQAGDEALRAVARTIVLTFPRRADVVARYGGDEFAVILTGTTGAEAEKLAERLLANLRQADAGGAPGRPMTVSVGVAEIEALTSPAEIVSRADRALYHAKRSGRDRSSSWAAVAAEKHHQSPITLRRDPPGDEEHGSLARSAAP